MYRVSINYSNYDGMGFWRVFSGFYTIILFPDHVEPFQANSLVRVYTSTCISYMAPNHQLTQCASQVLPNFNLLFILTIIYVLFELTGEFLFVKSVGYFSCLTFCCIFDNLLKVCSLTCSSLCQPFIFIITYYGIINKCSSHKRLFCQCTSGTDL